MQPLSAATNSGPVEACAAEVLSTVAPLMGFVRKSMRTHRKGLSIPQFRTLVWVEQHPCLTLSCLAEHLGASLPTASRIVAKMVNRGLIERSGREGDRREISLALTREGRTLLDAAWCATREEMGCRLNHLSPEQRQTVVAAMEILRSALGGVEMPPDASGTHCGVKD